MGGGLAAQGGIGLPHKGRGFVFPKGVSNMSKLKQQRSLLPQAYLFELPLCS